MVRALRRCPVCNSALSEAQYREALALHQRLSRELAHLQRQRQTYQRKMKKLAANAQTLASQNKQLTEQIERGETDQSQGLLEEAELLRFLKQRFPQDRFEHTRLGGDILQDVCTTTGEAVGRIVYEVKRVSKFLQEYVRQAAEARRLRAADYAILVTNCFPAKRKLFFVDGDVLVISAAGVEPLVHTARASLLSIHGLKVSGDQRSRAIQAVHDYLAGGEYSRTLARIDAQKRDLERLFKDELSSHKRVWKRRLTIYGNVFSDISEIDSKLSFLLSSANGASQKQLESNVPRLPAFSGPVELE